MSKRKVSYALLSLRISSQTIKNCAATISMAARCDYWKRHDEAFKDLLSAADDVISILASGWKSNPPSPEDELHKLKAAFISHEDLARVLLSDTDGMTERQYLAGLSKFRKMTKTLRRRAPEVYSMVKRDWPDRLTASTETWLKKCSRLR